MHGGYGIPLLEHDRGAHGDRLVPILGEDASGEAALLEERFRTIIDAPGQHHPVEKVEKAFAGLLVHQTGVHFNVGAKRVSPG